MGVNDMLVNLSPAIVTAVLLGPAALGVWKIHKTNQNVQHHKIGTLTEKEKTLLGSEVGTIWGTVHDQYVRGLDTSTECVGAGC